MAASIAIEIETGTITARLHPHNGYYAGSFSRMLPAQSAVDEEPRKAA